jgi:DNA polymerase III alpha subunit
MKTDKFGVPIYSNDDFLDMLYQGSIEPFTKMLADAEDAEIIKYNNNAEELGLEKINIYQNIDIELEEFDRLLQKNWHMPEEYKNMDIEGFLVNLCPKEHYNRLIEELQEFRRRDMLDLLRWLKYFVDTCRKNQVVWGVGRGSSVASYVLYLIGVHRIDSIKYNLDWQEFLR